jgi:hypothetical protein
MSIAPHFLDSVFDNVRGPEELLQAFVNSPEVQEIARHAVDAGEKQRESFEQNPKLRAADVRQVIRQVFLAGLNAASPIEALPKS